MSERLRMEAIDALLDENAELRRKVKALEIELNFTRGVTVVQSRKQP